MVAAFTLLALGCALPVLSRPLENRAIPSALYDNLRFYFQYATSAYATSCRKPNGNTLVKQFNNILTDTQGFIARDDTRKEIVVALRGTASKQDFVTDLLIAPVPYVSLGVVAPLGTLVHGGFLTAYNSVANTIISTVREQLKSFPNYTLVTTGHSLGGALSSLTAASLKGNFPTADVRMYTYGQPRTGNPGYAFWINDKLGSNVFRSVHTNDGVPAIPPKAILSEFRFTVGYRHHGVEYWQNPDPASATTTTQCAPNGEDPKCSSSISTTPFSPAHSEYYGISSSSEFCT